MLGKLKRTLTKNVSEERQPAGESGTLLRHTMTLCVCFIQLLNSQWRFKIASKLADADCSTHAADTIPAATLSSGPPNLLRPSPGLDVLSQSKTALSSNNALDR